MKNHRDPSHITDHAFTPRKRFRDGELRAEWWDLCGHPKPGPGYPGRPVCGLGEAAHAATLLDRDTEPDAADRWAEQNPCPPELGGIPEATA